MNEFFQQLTNGLAVGGIYALVALGYSQMEAAKAVRQVEIGEDMTGDQVLKASLRHLAF